MATKALNNMRIAAMAALAAMAASCSQPQPQHAAFFKMPECGWPYGMAFEYTPLDSAADSAYRVDDASIAVCIRHTNNYQYSNIWVELSYTPAACADTLVADTFDVRLADAYGHWLGTGIGVGFQRVDTIRPSRQPCLTRPLSLRHIMRADTLAGIEQAAIMLDIPQK